MCWPKLKQKSVQIASKLWENSSHLTYNWSFPGGQKYYWLKVGVIQKVELTAVKFCILTEPNNLSFGFGLMDNTLQFHHFIFTNTESRTGFDTFDLNFGWGNWKKSQDEWLFKDNTVWQNPIFSCKIPILKNFKMPKNSLFGAIHRFVEEN